MKNSAYFRIFELSDYPGPLPNSRHYVQTPSLLGFLRSSPPSGRSPWDTIDWDTSDSPSLLPDLRSPLLSLAPWDISLALVPFINPGCCTCFEVFHYNYYCLSTVILLGDSGVGKTSLWISFAAEKFSYNVLGTTAVDFAIRNA